MELIVLNLGVVKIKLKLTGYSVSLMFYELLHQTLIAVEGLIIFPFLYIKFLMRLITIIVELQLIFIYLELKMFHL